MKQSRHSCRYLLAGERALLNALVMADSSLTSFLTALQNIHGAGRFCAQGSIEFVPPGIVLKNEDDLALPLNSSQAAVLRELAEAAPYGMGSETRLDESVRKCWQIDAAELRWTSKKWKGCLDALVKKITEELGIEGKVTAEPYKLLMYDKGGFFLPHRDTEKVPGMFGTLIVCLPSRHSGGELVLRHHGQEERMDFGAEFDPSEIRWAAFFADCEHEVLPVISGHRLCMTFNLVLAGKTGKTPSAPAGGAAALLPGLKDIAKTRGDDVTAILLEHRYTEESISVAALKGDDRARAAALFEAAESAGLTARLALVSLYQMGQLEEDYEHDYYSRKRRRGSSDETDGEMGEVYEESLTIEHWRTPEDKKVPLGSFTITESQLLSLTELGEGDPDEKFAEGYTGNAGCTMEHWYRRAAICVWPQDAAPVLLARYDFTAACEGFATLAAKRSEAAASHARALIQEARQRLDSANEYQAESLGKALRPLLRGTGELGDESLYPLIARGDFITAFLQADPVSWVALLSGFGVRPLEFLRGYTPSGSVTVHGAAWFCAVDAMLGHAPDFLPRHADMLPRLVSSTIPPPRYSHPEDATLIKPSYRAHLILAASCVVTKPADQQTLESWLLSNGNLTHLREVLAPALLLKTHCSWFKKSGSLAPHILQTAIDHLAGECARAIVPYPDFKRHAPATTSSDVLIHGLLSFMADPKLPCHEIRRPQQERTRVEEYVRRHDLDLDLRTLTKGSPHTLICTKNEQSYHRALKQRAKDEKLLESLREVKCV